MFYVLVRNGWEYAIRGECTAAAFQREGYEVAFAGAYFECREFVNNAG